MLSAKIKELRIKNNLTQADLARKLNVSQNAVYNWENGKRQPRLEKLDDIAEALNVDVWTLYGDYKLGTVYDIEISDSDLEGLEHFRPLNDDNKDKAIDYMDLLKLRQDSTPDQPDQSLVPSGTQLNAAHERTDIEVTDEMRKHDDKIMDDDDF